MRQRRDRLSGEFERKAHEKEPGLIAEFWEFHRGNKRWWLWPITSALLSLSLLAALTASGAGPFIDSFF